MRERDKPAYPVPEAVAQYDGGPETWDATGLTKYEMTVIEMAKSMHGNTDFLRSLGDSEGVLEAVLSSATAIWDALEGEK